ncbi:conserved hypothetical protein [Cupriavidus necator]|uniref:DUF6884 domain-containing protein n=2 Tax=Cupriavidus necator TaxID=106590 RepID=A0A1K0I9Z8_CUPNE|nr:conserved hypothetical protein [Cupriavidus necator]
MQMLSRQTQLSLFPTSSGRVHLANAPALLLLACSGTKLDRQARAIDLYQGVMYEFYREHLRREARPNVLILSARHGFLDPHAVIDPYDQRMTAPRADAMLADLPAFAGSANWPAQVGKVLLAGGKEYRRVMRAALARQYNTTLLAIQETTGGIGMQRSQLGAFLDGLAPRFNEPMGHHPNGTPLYRRYGWIEAGAVTGLIYRAAPYMPAVKARVLALFQGPSGPTADVEVEEIIRGRTSIGPRWVGAADLHPLQEAA